jgi:tight adherence protein B
MSAAVVAALLAGVIVAIGWPAGVARRRLRASYGRPRVALRSFSVRRPLKSVAGWRPRRLITLAAALAGVTGLALGGPVAALVGSVYGALGARAWVRHVRTQRDGVARARSLDDLCALAADLRAGLPPAAAELHQGRLSVTVGGSRATAATAFSNRPAGGPLRAEGRLAGGTSKRAIHAELRIAELAAAVWRLAESTGAAAADLVERIEADARAADRGRASAAAEAAGAQATALLLAALPLAGIGLGYGIGADPLRVLLHTPLGAACAAAAVALQCAGLFWADRLVNGAAR